MNNRYNSMTDDEIKEIIELAGFKDVEIDDFLVTDNVRVDYALEDYIKEGVWAFNASFLANFIDMDESHIGFIQEKLCEDCNDLFLQAIGDKLNKFIEEAVSSDGRGHFLSGYDGVEN